MQYNIILLVDGSLSLEQANQVNEKQQQTLTNVEGLQTEYLGLKELAYPIKKQLSAHYYRWKFSGDNQSTKDFKRTANINKQVLRELIINLEREYGYLASINPKKQQLALQKRAKYDEIIARENNPENPDVPVTSGLASTQPRLSRTKKAQKPKEELWDVVQKMGNFDSVQANPYRPRFKRFNAEHVNQRQNQQNNNNNRFDRNRNRQHNRFKDKQ